MPRGMKRSPKANEAISRAVDDVNSIKSDLIRIVRKLEESGADAKARTLDRIIGRLESWQASR